MSTTYNDYELIYMIQQQDEAALKMLIIQYDYVFYFLAKDACGFESKSIIDDLRQEAIECFYSCIDRYRHDQFSFYTFFTKCIKRRLMDKMRTMASNNYVVEYRGVSLDSLEETPAGRRLIGERAASYVEKPLEVQCRIACAQEAARLLGETEERILRYRVEGFSCREIAELMKSTEKNIYYRLRKIQLVADEIYEKTLS